MKNIKLIISVFVLVFFIGCSNQDDLPNIDAINASTNISALMTIKQDNSGKVTILPNGEGVSQYEIFFGEHKPARTTVEVSRLPREALVEIECVAELVKN